MKSLCDRWILQFKLCFLLFLYHKFKLCKVLMERLRWCKICSPRLWYQWSEKIVTMFYWVPYALKFALKFACSKLTAPEIYFALHWQAIQRKVLKADCVIRQFSCRSKFLRILLRLFVRGCVWRLRVGLPTKKFPVPTRSFIFFYTNFLLCIKFVRLNSQSFMQCNSRRFTSCFADNAWFWTPWHISVPSLFLEESVSWFDFWYRRLQKSCIGLISICMNSISRKSDMVWCYSGLQI